MASDPLLATTIKLVHPATGVFFLLLLLQLREDINAWPLVFSPLFLAFLISLFVTAKTYRSLVPAELLPGQYRKSVLGLCVQTIRTIEGATFVSLLCVRLAMPDTFEISFSLLFLPVWVGTALKSVLTTKHASINPDAEQNTGSFSLIYLVYAVMSDLEFILSVFICTKLNGTSTVGWTGTFCSLWVLIAAGFVVSSILVGVLIYLCFAPDVGDTFGYGPTRRKYRNALLLALFLVTAVSGCYTYSLDTLIRRLQGDGSASVELIMLPVIVAIFVCDAGTLLLITLVTRLPESSAHERREDADDPNAEAEMLSLPKPERLIRQTSTLFRQYSSAALLSLSETKGDSDDMSSELVPHAVLTENQTPEAPVDSTEVAIEVDPMKTSACIICLERHPNAVFMPCGHGGVCIECGMEVWRRNARACPLCRESVKQVLTVSNPQTTKDGQIFVEVK